jgi:LEA14-like dessication related protein
MLDKAKNFVAEKLTTIEKPEASIDNVDFKRVSSDSVEYLAKLSVKNPYGYALPVCEISYTLKSAGRFHLIISDNLFLFLFLFSFFLIY